MWEGNQHSLVSQDTSRSFVLFFFSPSPTPHVPQVQLFLSGCTVASTNGGEKSSHTETLTPAQYFSAEVTQTFSRGSIPPPPCESHEMPAPLLLCFLTFFISPGYLFLYLFTFQHVGLKRNERERSQPCNYVWLLCKFRINLIFSL